MTKFARLDRLPPYVFATVNQIKMDARRSGEDIIDLGMGNPDMGTPQHIVDKLVEAAQKPPTTVTRHPWALPNCVRPLRTGTSGVSM